MRHSPRFVSSNLVLQLAVVLLLGAIMIFTATLNGSSAVAASCTQEPRSATGKSTYTLTVPVAGEYTIWSRLKAPANEPAGYQVYVSGECISIGQAPLSAGDFTWIDYEDGLQSNKAKVNLSAGSHVVVMTAGTEGLELDRVMFIPDSCTPAGRGDNCEVDSVAPTVSLISPGDSKTLSGNVRIAAEANDNDEIDYVEFYLDGVALLGTDRSAPYSISWDTAAASNGLHDLSARAYDLSGNNAMSDLVNVRVSNTLLLSSDDTETKGIGHRLADTGISVTGLVLVSIALVLIGTLIVYYLRSNRFTERDS